MSTVLSIPYLHLVASLAAAFGVGATLAALISVAIHRAAIRPHITVQAPEVRLPDSLHVIVQQPPPPPAPKGRAELWQEVYSETLDMQGSPSYGGDIDRAKMAADAAVRGAFPDLS